jgi:diketogulonate reductase-like aldo/keto reductase
MQREEPFFSTAYEQRPPPENSLSPSVSRRAFLRTASLIGAGIALGRQAQGQAAMTGSGQVPVTSEEPEDPTGVTDSAPSQISRKTTGALGPAGSGPKAPSAVLDGPAAGVGEIPLRPLGKTGLTVSALGLGGHHLGDANTVDEAMNIVHEAVDCGVTFFDNCWEYHNGKSEDWLGRALVGGRRDKIVLMTKVCTHGRTKQLAMQMLEQSLRRLQTDHLDVWQIHAITYDNDPELAYAKNGVLEAMDLAKQQGKVRFVGFTGHKDPGIHLKMLGMGYPFDTCQFPLNPFDYSFFSFERQVLPYLNEHDIAPLGMKSMSGGGEAIKAGLVTAEELLSYAMSLPVATTIAGMDSLDVLHQNLRVARGFTPMIAEEMQELRTRCSPVSADGRYEPYKVTIHYDNPMTRMPHGFPLDATIKEVPEMLITGNGMPGDALLTPTL